jgi:hypothetical protein
LRSIPDYTDALYQLGAHLVTWAGDTKTAANQLKFGDPNYNKMLQESDDDVQKSTCSFREIHRKKSK